MDSSSNHGSPEAQPRDVWVTDSLVLFVQAFLNNESEEDVLDFNTSDDCYTIIVKAMGIKIRYCTDTQMYEMFIPKGIPAVTNDGLCGNANGDPDDDEPVGITLLLPTE